MSLLLNVLSYYCYSQFIRLIMCSEIGHFHRAVISITIKYDFKHLGRSGALATGEDIENEASQRKQLEVRSFQGLVSRITEPTIQGIGGREQNTVCHKRMAGKRRLAISYYHFRQKLYIHYTNIDQ